MQHARAPLQRDAAPTQHKRQSAQNHRGGTPTGVLSLWHEANPAARRSTITGYTRAHAEIQVSNEAGVTSFFGALGSAFPLAAVGAVCGVRWEWGKSVCVSPSCERLVPSPEASRRHVVSCSSCSPMVVQQHTGAALAVALLQFPVNSLQQLNGRLVPSPQQLTTVYIGGHIHAIAAWRTATGPLAQSGKMGPVVAPAPSPGPGAARENCDLPLQLAI